jgi:uncharacterized tellurite resistance protein B-like protein
MVDPNVRRKFATLVAVAFADGKLADSERQLLDRKAWSMDLPAGLLRELLDLGRQGKLSAAMPATAGAKAELLDEMIDLVCADGRVEAPEHHLLAKIATQIGLPLPDLRARVRERMDRRTSSAPRPPGKPPAAEPPAVPAGDSGMKNFGVGVAAVGRVEKSGEEHTALPPGPVRLEGPQMAPPQVADLPPVTLQLIKQAIAFESEVDALHYIQRTLGVADAEARRVYASILAAFPDLRPGSQQLRAPRK